MNFFFCNWLHYIGGKGKYSPLRLFFFCSLASTFSMEMRCSVFLSVRIKALVRKVEYTR